MMKKVLLAVMLIFSSSSIVRADFDYTGWEFGKVLEGSRISTDGYGIFDLDSEVYNGSSADLRDLRVVDTQGRETQYFISSGQESEQQFKDDASIIKRVFAPKDKDYSIIIVDAGDKRLPVNQVDLDISNKDFLKRVEIQGSDELDIWCDINSENYIYHISEKGIRSTSLNFEPVRHKYIKLKIYNEANNPLQIQSVKVWFNKIHNYADRVTYTNTVSREENKLHKETSLILDLKYYNLPVNAVELKSGDINFDRKVRIETGNHLDKMTQIGMGEIYNYSLNNISLNKAVIDFNQIPCRYVRLLISNFDNQPLNVLETKVYGPKKKVIFKTEAGKVYSIFYGSKSACNPVYEIDNVIPYIKSFELPIYKLGKEQHNDKYIRPQTTSDSSPKSDVSRHYLILALSGMCLVLGIILVKAFRGSISKNSGTKL